MNQQLFLFELPTPTVQEMLLDMAKHGNLFYSVSDVARLSGYSGYQVYWAIWYLPPRCYFHLWPMEDSIHGNSNLDTGKGSTGGTV